jgi:hypothetical protein
MRCLRFQPFLIACSALVVAAGMSSLCAAEAQKSSGPVVVSLAAGAPVATGDLPFSSSLRQDTAAAAPAGFLKTETSLGKRTNLDDPGEAHRSATENGKVNTALDNVQAVAIPEPTALFIAGMAGCLLLGVAQRLRGPRPGI